jgi:DNA modification methylase
VFRQDDGQKPGAAPAADRTSKPIALVADALLDCTAKGEIVLDQFAASGATILGAEKVGAVARGLEQSPAWSMSPSSDGNA